MPPDVNTSPPAPTSAKDQAKQATRIALMAITIERRQFGEHYSTVVRRQSYALQEWWLREADTQRVMGLPWCKQQLGKLRGIELRLQEIVPSGAWFEAMWRGEDVFPPQDRYTRGQVRETLTALHKSGAISERRYHWALNLLDDDVDPLQIIARVTSRMRPAKQLVRYGVDAFENDQPMAGPHTRRLTPPQSIGHGDGTEDKYDAMAPDRAIFAVDPPSCSALAIIKIGLMQGRDQTAIDRKRAKKRAAKKKKLAAIKASYGIVDDEPVTSVDEDGADD